MPWLSDDADMGGPTMGQPMPPSPAFSQSPMAFASSAPPSTVMGVTPPMMTSPNAGGMSGGPVQNLGPAPGWTNSASARLPVMR